MKENGEAYHYILIRDLNILLIKTGAVSNPRIYCPNCCHRFIKRYTNDEKMETHMVEYFTNGGTKVKMPDLCLTNSISNKLHHILYMLILNQC